MSTTRSDFGYDVSGNYTPAFLEPGTLLGMWDGHIENEG